LSAMQISSNMAKIALSFESHGSGFITLILEHHALWFTHTYWSCYEIKLLVKNGRFSRLCKLINVWRCSTRFYVALRPIFTQEKFPYTERFPKISLLKVEHFRRKFVSANHILQNFLSAEHFPEWIHIVDKLKQQCWTIYAGWKFKIELNPTLRTQHSVSKEANNGENPIMLDNVGPTYLHTNFLIFSVRKGSTLSL
jgi:hypothetical protein